MDVSDSIKPSDQKRPVIEGAVKKRKPIRPSVARSDIYVTRDPKKFQSQVNRARRLLLDRHYPSIAIHGLGAAIPQAISIASAVKACLSDETTMDVTTDTVNIYDDIVPTDTTKDIATQVRQTSAIHIKMALPDKLKTLIGTRR
ncbi:hypothetical protein GGI02_005959 [Coemansia sp. RSA 2322]|uniref:Uncharacterized protein n=1 Tax=Coemansia thaxteri TaxID=2663907 RepID=A0A9W8BE19_9FUNG|nr:hypothetical protein H4R26_002735 [Coemansia thaxteri]KAJ2458845.1 hypothetical protein GGI02_005959 [Coemansia sp. RSA 2322]KAJ2484634.1 hypothetical protein EV174_002277 [Coemansia sp. RSA 2320]